MELIVDFNRVDKGGRFPALIPAGHERDFAPGVKVSLTDGEGTHVRGIVDEVGHSGRFVYVVRESGTPRHEPPPSHVAVAADVDTRVSAGARR